MLIITLILSAFFVFASSIKLFAWQQFIFETQLTFFKKYGLNRFYMRLVGLIELSAALLLATSVIVNLALMQLLGAALIAITSIGAIYFHLRFDTFKDAIPAVITLTLSAVLLISNMQHIEHMCQLLKQCV